MIYFNLKVRHDRMTTLAALSTLFAADVLEHVRGCLQMHGSSRSLSGLGF